jgi:hypothetical protein
MGLRRHGGWYALGSAATAAVSLAMVTWQGYKHPLHAALVYAFYGAGGLALNVRWRRPAISYVSLALLLEATVWWLGWSHQGRPEVWAAVEARSGGPLQWQARGRWTGREQKDLPLSRWSEFKKVSGVLVTNDAPNNFPQHPVRADGPYLVWLGILEGDRMLEERIAPLAERSAL